MAKFLSFLIEYLYFLLLKTRRGKITRAALRRLIDTFKFAISDEQFNELVSYLDPEGTNSISYQKFLDLFEVKENEVRIHVMQLKFF